MLNKKLVLSALNNLKVNSFNYHVSKVKPSFEYEVEKHSNLENHLFRGKNKKVTISDVIMAHSGRKRNILFDIRKKKIKKITPASRKKVRHLIKIVFWTTFIVLSSKYGFNKWLQHVSLNANNLKINGHMLAVTFVPRVSRSVPRFVHHTLPLVAPTYGKKVSANSQLVMPDLKNNHVRLQQFRQYKLQKTFPPRGGLLFSRELLEVLAALHQPLAVAVMFTMNARDLAKVVGPEIANPASTLGDVVGKVIPLVQVVLWATGHKTAAQFLNFFLSAPVVSGFAVNSNKRGNPLTPRDAKNKKDYDYLGTPKNPSNPGYLGSLENPVITPDQIQDIRIPRNQNDNTTLLVAQPPHDPYYLIYQNKQISKKAKHYSGETGFPGQKSGEAHTHHLFNRSLDPTTEYYSDLTFNTRRNMPEKALVGMYRNSTHNYGQIFTKMSEILIDKYATSPEMKEKLHLVAYVFRSAYNFSDAQMEDLENGAVQTKHDYD